MADGKSNKKNKQDDEIDFLLSNVNEDSQTQPKRVKHKRFEILLIRYLDCLKIC